METKILKINAQKIDPKKITLAARIIKNNGLVVFPTETVYGLGSNALEPNAVKKIFKVKGRPLDNPIILHIAEERELEQLTEDVPEKAYQLMKKFWPGPLTLILKKSLKVPKIVTANLDTVAVRLPSHQVALELIKKAKVPIAAPSANLAGKASPTLPEHVIQDLKGKVEVIIDSKGTSIGLESTVINLSSPRPTLLRPGGITLEELEDVLGEVEVHPVVRAEKKFKDLALSPGMKYRHYAPEADLILVEGEKEKVRKKIISLAENYQKEGKKVGIITTNQHHYRGIKTKFLGETLEEKAKNLFKTLREMDKDKVEIILVEEVEPKGLGLGIMNRLRKASSEVIKV